MDVLVLGARLLFGLFRRLARVEIAFVLVAEQRDEVGDNIGDVLVLGPRVILGLLGRLDRVENVLFLVVMSMIRWGNYTAQLYWNIKYRLLFALRVHE